MQDRFRSGGPRPPSGGGNRYPQGGGGGGNRRRRGGGGRRPGFPEFTGPENEEVLGPLDEEQREPNPDADQLHLAYDSVYTHEGDAREELLEGWVAQSEAGKRWRCWNCSRQTQRYTQLRFPTFRTVLSICDNCSMWTVWDAWRDIANPRVFNLRRTVEVETPPSANEPQRTPGNGAHDNGNLAGNVSEMPRQQTERQAAPRSTPTFGGPTPAQASLPMIVPPAAAVPAPPVVEAAAPVTEAPKAPAEEVPAPAVAANLPSTDAVKIEAPSAQVTTPEASVEAPAKPKRTRSTSSARAEPRNLDDTLRARERQRLLPRNTGTPAGSPLHGAVALSGRLMPAPRSPTPSAVLSITIL